jgi:hypothetical protein
LKGRLRVKVEVKVEEFNGLILFIAFDPLSFPTYNLQLSPFNLC